MHLFQKSLKTGLVTTRYPAVSEPPPAAMRGRPVLDPNRCSGNGRCAEVCPAACIEVLPAQRGSGWSWQLDLAPCLFCGLCAEACPTGAITMSNDFELAVRDRRDLINRVTFRAPAAATLASARPVEPPAGPPTERPTAPLALERLAEAVDRRVRRFLRRSLHLRHVDVGSDNAADWELTALLNPIYDLQRFGIDVVASPRHADLLVVTGAVSHNSTMALLRTYAATPEPRLVVALGADACGGGLLQGGYATAGGVDRVIPVDVYIPGCPPRPQAILYGLLLAMDRLSQKQQASDLEQPAP